MNLTNDPEPAAAISLVALAAGADVIVTGTGTCSRPCSDRACRGCWRPRRLSRSGCRSAPPTAPAEPYPPTLDPAASLLVAEWIP